MYWGDDTLKERFLIELRPSSPRLQKIVDVVKKLPFAILENLNENEGTIVWGAAYIRPSMLIKLQHDLGAKDIYVTYIPRTAMKGVVVKFTL